MAKLKKNYLLEKVYSLFLNLPKGMVLDLGCGEGEYANKLTESGFHVIAADINDKRFKYSGKIEFKKLDLTEKIPFSDSSFEYCILTEVLEHIRNPYHLLSEINRILKKNGFLVLSTPNILNLKSRYRFLLEGTYEYFREPLLEQAEGVNEASDLHLTPFRYHELEYILFKTGFAVERLTTSIYEHHWLWFLLPFIYIQTGYKKSRALRNGGIDFSRINKILLSKELLFGRHLIILAKKRP